jgi:hypothetical protein
MTIDEEMVGNYYEHHQTHPNFGLVWIDHRIVKGNE